MRAMEYGCKCYHLAGRTAELVDAGCALHGPYRTRVNTAKRLTDAECAAEYWAARGEWLQANVRRPPGTDTSPDGDRLRRERVLTTHRFATCPHASEVEA